MTQLGRAQHFPYSYSIGRLFRQFYLSYAYICRKVAYGSTVGNAGVGIKPVCVPG